MRQMQDVKELIEDLLQDRLTEEEIKINMENLGFKYTSDSTIRWQLLLEELGEPQPPSENTL